MESLILAQTVLPLPAVVVAKEVETYEQRVGKMSDKALTAELRRFKRKDKTVLGGGLVALVLQIVMENHTNGMEPFINRSTRFKPFER